MTLSKTYHANNVMQDLVEACSYCDHKSCLNCDVSVVPLLNWKKIESHFETWSSDAQRINLTFVAHSLVANFVRYISAKYYLNWFSFHTFIMEVLGVNFFLKHSVHWSHSVNHQVTVWKFRKEIVRYRREQMFLVSVLLTSGTIYRSIW